MIYVDGTKYEGGWKDDVFFGKGDYMFSDGSGYSGNWKDMINADNVVSIVNGTITDKGKLINGEFVPDKK